MNKVLFLYVSGVVLALAGAAIMFEGSLLGKRTTGIAIIIGIIGLGLIATSSRLKTKKGPSQ